MFLRAEEMVVIPKRLKAKPIGGTPQLLEFGIVEALVELDRDTHVAILIAAAATDSAQWVNSATALVGLLPG
jgi:hypothetical protein